MAAIRPAQRGEAARLSALCIRSKAHWGYDAAFMALSAPSLAVDEGDIVDGRVLVAVDGANVPVGVACVIMEAAVADLDLMFVDPPEIGRGAGRALFAAAADLARRLGARRMTILADPNAAPFYERMGARYLRQAPSDAIPGRTLPFYEYDLSP
ncbi:MAG: GNAT family N-acetyltransferase [Reyranella sp.]|uniref:GNAT family N-acetyltransferase n=1 Tax=Reyranella sp. TaxID=1929291 RepID=UPI003D12445E